MDSFSFIEDRSDDYGSGNVVLLGVCLFLEIVPCLCFVVVECVYCSLFIPVGHGSSITLTRYLLFLYLCGRFPDCLYVTNLLDCCAITILPLYLM